MPEEAKPPGRGQGLGSIAGHEKGQDALIDALVAALDNAVARIAALETEADGVTA